MKNFKVLAILCALTITSACSTTPTEEDARKNDPYYQTIDRYSAGDSEYNGMHNQFEFRATLLAATTREAINRKQAEYYQWDEAKLAQEREKTAQELSSQVTVFFSFYTPERVNDNLTDGKSIWRIFLDVDGKRYVGKIRKIRKLLAELSTLYPYHTRWNTAYSVTFDVPAKETEAKKVVFTITGPLGTRTTEFAPQ